MVVYQLEKLTTLRYNFIDLLCKHFNIENLDQLYKSDPKMFVRKITTLKFKQFSCKDYLKILTPYLINKNIRPVERLYHILYGHFKINPVGCKICGNPTKFINEIAKGYRQYCSDLCRQQDYSIINIKAHTTYFEKTGFKNPSQDPIVKDKKKETTLKNYGCSHINYSKKVMEQRKQKYLEKTGFEHSFQNPEIKNKIKQSHLDKTGYENPSLNPVIVAKRANTYRIRTGYDCSLQNPEIQEKIRQKNLEIYGFNNPAKSIEIQQKMATTQQLNFFNRLLTSERLKSRYIPLFTIDNYTGVKGNKKYKWKCIKCNTIFEDDIDNGNLPKCPICYPSVHSSIPEQNLIDWCKKYYTVILERSKDLIPPYEIDVFIPEIRLGIEFNGLYWHSELGGNKDREYHQKKLLLALQNNIQLIQIFEDEFRDKQDIVESIIINKFGKNQTRIFARKCQIYSVFPNDAQKFYFDNHMQGFTNGQHLGLYYNDEPVSMITFGKPRFEINHETEIYRFCNKNNTSVVGSLSRLIKAMISVTNTKSIITYADARYGIGLGYYKCGFKFVNTSQPGYYYMKHYDRRLSRNQFQKYKLKDKLKDFDPTLTEWENMQLNGYDRICDCGNFVYELIL